MRIAKASRRSRLLFHWRSNEALLTSVNGLAPTFARAATATGTDALGASYTAVNGQPCWNWYSNVPKLSLGGSDLMYWSFPALPQAMTLYAKFRALIATSAGTATYGLLYLGNAGVTGALLSLEHLTGTAGYIGYHANGVSNTNSGAVTGAAVNDEVELMLTFTSGGVAQVTQSIAGAASTTGTASGALALAAAWGDTRLYVNSTGGSNAGANAFEVIKIAYGSGNTLAQMRVAF